MYDKKPIRQKGIGQKELIEITSSGLSEEIWRTMVYWNC